MSGRSCHYFVGTLLVFLALFLTGCEEQINYPAPNAKSISPTQIQAGQPAFTLTVTGANFTPATTVEWNGSPRTTFFTTSTTLTAQILATDIQNPGIADITVVTPSPGGGTSPVPPSTLQFVIQASSSPIPQITSLSPSGVFVGSASFTLTVTGTNFVGQSQVLVNGIGHPTAYVNSATLQTTILSTDVASAGTVQISVVNPAPNGGTSSNFALTVKNPVPGNTSVSPTAAVAGTPPVTITLTGTGYVPTSVIDFNGSPRTTAFLSSTQISATLTAGDLAQGGVNQLVVVNPGPGGGNSNIVTFSVTPTDVEGLPVLVDVAPNGDQANNGICGTCTSGTPTLTTAGPSTNQSGQYVAYASNSTNLLATPTSGLSTVFLSNTCLSASTTATTSSCAPSTNVAFGALNGVAPNGASYDPSIDTGNSHVVFTSTATNLENYVDVPGGITQVYWAPTCTASTTTTTCATSTTATSPAALISVSADGTTAGNGPSYGPVISPDGEYVAFVSLATNLVTDVAADGITPQVYIRSTCGLIPPNTGTCVPTTYLVSTPDGTTPGNGPSSQPAISETGLFVAFSSTATNLGGAAPNPSSIAEIFDRSTCITSLGEASSTCIPETTLASTPDGTTPADGASVDPAISSDGRFVAFASIGKNLIAGAGPTQEVYFRDTCTNTTTIETNCTAATYLASTPDGTTPANGLSESPSINECGSTTVCITGQYIAFASFATNLGGNVENGIENIFVRDSCIVFPESIETTSLCSPYTFLASQPAGTTPSAADGDSTSPSLSGDGHTVSFISLADNLVPHDTNGFADVFLANANLTYELTLTMAGTGAGTVTDDQSQIDCTQTSATKTTPLIVSGTCSARYPSGTTVTLTATATAGTNSTFTGWSGSATSVSGASCTVTTGSTTTGTCSFAMIQNNTVTATFGGTGQ